METQKQFPKCMSCLLGCNNQIALKEKTFQRQMLTKVFQIKYWKNTEMDYCLKHWFLHSFIRYSGQERCSATGKYHKNDTVCVEVGKSVVGRCSVSVSKFKGSEKCCYINFVCIYNFFFFFQTVMGVVYRSCIV